MESRDLLAFSVSTLCRGVDVKILASLLAQAPCRVEARAAGGLVLPAGTRYDELRVLLEGRVNADMQSPAGKLLTIETLKAPDPIASAILFAPNQALPVTVTAATDCRLLVLPLEVVLDLCRADRRFLLNFLTEIGGKVSLLAEKFHLLEFSSLRQRIVAYLAPRLTAGALTLEFSKEKMAELLSVARPSLSRELSALAAEGILAVRGRRIQVLDQTRFDRLAADKA